METEHSRPGTNLCFFYFSQTVRKMFVNYEDSLQGIILKVDEKCLFQKVTHGF